MFGNSVAKSICSPLIILSLILGGTEGRSWSVEVVILVGLYSLLKIDLSALAVHCWYGGVQD